MDDKHEVGAKILHVSEFSLFNFFVNVHSLLINIVISNAF